MSDRECQRALKDFYSAIEKAQTARDTEGMLATMSEDIVLLAPDTPALVGKTAVGGYYQNAFAAFSAEGHHTRMDFDPRRCGTPMGAIFGQYETCCRRKCDSIEQQIPICVPTGT